MEVILRETIDTLGRAGEVVKVKPGYARNYLLPRKLAYLATPGNLKVIEFERQSLIRKEAKQKGDLAFLKGDWRSRTGLATATGERDLRPNYTLDDKGKGKVTFVQKNGTTCEAPAEARWDGSKLVIEEKANPKCADGKTYARNTVNCEVGQDGVAKCTGSQPGDKRSYNVQFGR